MNCICGPATAGSICIGSIRSAAMTKSRSARTRSLRPCPAPSWRLLAEVGATLEKGAPILTLEVMKMEQTLRAPFAGVLKAIKCKVGDIVQEGVELAEIEPAAAMRFA